MTRVALDAGLSLREETEADEPFLRHLYEATRVEEFAGLAWNEATRRAFFDQQFAAQTADYRRRFPHGSFLVVELEGAAIGRLSLGDEGDALRVLDIALLPERRGHGVGEALLRWVIAKGRPIRLSVARWNRAQSLYLRLGFIVAAEDEVYLHLERPS